ncbi:hypothetical protein M758_3G131800 [Ceratodon purpureus]|nr:hypothetical protein M758_3G131800 [Ceratodon purpureus]
MWGKRLVCSSCLSTCLDADEDDEELRITRLEVLASERRNSSFTIFGFLVIEQVDLKQYLARHLLKKNKIQSGLRNPLSSLEDLKGHMWEKDDEPIRAWGESKFLGARSGTNGVCKTSWLGVPCAKKVFHGEGSETIFMKEASIMARLKHWTPILGRHCTCTPIVRLFLDVRERAQ